MHIREFERNFKSLYLPLGMYALRLTGDPDIAEDLVQEAFVRAWELMKEGKEISAFKAWMYRCVHNSCIDRMRCNSSCSPIPENFDVEQEDIDTSERDAAVWKAIDELPERCRHIFLMSKRDGLSNDEIAVELGLSVKTVKNQLTKALSRLRESLGKGRKPFFLPFL